MPKRQKQIVYMIELQASKRLPFVFIIHALLGGRYQYFLRLTGRNIRAFCFKNKVWDNILWRMIAVRFMIFLKALLWYA